MKAKIFIIITLVSILTACGKPETISAPVVTPPLPPVVSTPTPTTEMTPADVRGAELTGKAQDMPVGTSEGPASTDPTLAPVGGDPAPIPSSN